MTFRYTKVFDLMELTWKFEIGTFQSFFCIDFQQLNNFRIIHMQNLIIDQNNNNNQ